MDFQPWDNRVHLIGRIADEQSGGDIFQGLLKQLSLQELVALNQHGDLKDRIKKITQLTDTAAMSILRTDYDLLTENCHTGEVWISTDELDDALPKWCETSHCGWYLTVSDGEFLEWARDFFLQEVRINIWMRRLEKAKSSPKQEPFSTGHYL